MLWAQDWDVGAWDPVVRVVPFALGAVLLGLTFASLVRTMVIPRNRVSALYALIIRTNDGVFRLLMLPRRGYPPRDRVLAWSGAIGIIVALVVWMGFFLIAYGLMIFGVSDGGLGDSFYQAGSGLLTLGLVGTPTGSVTFVDFMAAMTGPAVIALLIGFLPTLYQAYLSREDRVLLSSSLSGAPAWGPELLSRSQLLGDTDDLPQIYADWIEWTTQTRLTQTLYPALNRFRSPVDSRNWLMSLLAIMDSAALRIAVRNGVPDPHTVGILEQGAQTILSLYATEVEIREALPFRRWGRQLETTLSIFGIASKSGSDNPQFSGPSAGLTPTTVAVAKALTIDNLRGRLSDTKDVFAKYDSKLSTITREEFDHALDVMHRSGVAIERNADDAFTIFRRQRGRYEEAAYHLAQIIYAPRAPWSGPRKPDTEVIWPTLAVDQLPPSHQVPPA